MDPSKLARLLASAGPVEVTAAEIRRHIAAGAPANRSGRMSLVAYAAWLVARLERPNERVTRPRRKR